VLLRRGTVTAAGRRWRCNCRSRNSSSYSCYDNGSINTISRRNVQAAQGKASPVALFAVSAKLSLAARQLL